MSNIFSSNYLARKPIELAMKEFAQRFSEEQSVLDIGCGNMPYKKLFRGTYIGLDPIDTVKPDVVGNAWDLPFQDHQFDGIILNQSLEHIAKTEKTVAEIHRVLKPGGTCIVTVPHTMKNHSIPVPPTQAPSFVKSETYKQITHWQTDYYRFTKYGLIYLFRNFQIKTIQETSGYLGTMMQLFNYFLASLGSWSWIFAPIFLLNNIIGQSIDCLFLFLAKKVHLSLCSRFYNYIYSSLPLNYIIIIKKAYEK